MEKKIKQLRLDKQWSQKELAKRAGIIQNQLSNYETGKTKPSMQVLKKLAKALGVEYTYFLDEAPDADLKETEPDLSDVYMKAVFEETLSQLDQKSRRFLLDFLLLLKWKMEIKKM